LQKQNKPAREKGKGGGKNHLYRGRGVSRENQGSRRTVGRADRCTKEKRKGGKGRKGELTNERENAKSE